MTFAEEYQDFLFTLRDKYGFLIPVDRIKMCLVCANDIRDVREVCYRTQSLVCTSQEQIEIFQSVFGQKFLHKSPPPPSSTKKNNFVNGGNGQKEKSQPETLESIRQMRSDKEQALKRTKEYIESLEETNRLRTDIAEEIAEQKSEAAKTVSAHQQEVEKSQKALSDAETAALPDMDDKGLKSAYDKVGNLLQEVNLSHLQGKIFDALKNPEYAKALPEIEKTLMEQAKAARNAKDMNKFKQILNVVAAMKALTTAAGKSVKKDKKTDLANAKKELQAKNEQLKQSNNEMQRLEEKEGNQRREIEQTKRQIQNNQNTIKKLEDQIQQMQDRAMALELERKMREEKIAKSTESETIVQKDRALTHRFEFLEGIRSVQTLDEIAELMKTDIRQMSSEDKDKILSFIRSNARAFKQTLRRKSSTVQHRHVDVKATVKAAAKTGGEPLIIKYKKPKKSHANVVMLTDISGSCRVASTLALYFMALMNEVFPGGCKKFVFVNDLVPVDKYFANQTADDGVSAVTNSVPTRGIYSNYGQTIETLKKEYSGLIRKDTTLIVIGDARNNSYDSHAEDLKYLADRCHSVFWLNPDDTGKWNQGDSVIGKYKQAGASVYAVRTAGDLLGFLSSISVG